MNISSRILIVDDEPNVRLVFRTALDSAGYAVEEARDGEEALGLLRHSSFDLMLLDLQMPRMDGSETLKRVREEGMTLPVIVVTAHGSIPDAVVAMKLGAIDFLSKPLTPEALRKVVAEVVERHAKRKAESLPRAAESVIPLPPFQEKMMLAKKALNQRAFDEGLDLLTQAIDLNPMSAEAHNLMGVLHELRSEHDASYREYRTALKADRHYEPAKQNMNRYFERFTFGRSNLPIDTGDR